jgi:5-methylcytosine-specific restriction endonuclease McrA
MDIAKPLHSRACEARAAVSSPGYADGTGRILACCHAHAGAAADRACYEIRMMLENRLESLSDDDLLARLRDLVRAERQSTAEVTRHIAEVDARRLYLGQACLSMFAYCTGVLHYSEYAALQRIHVARAARRFPLLLERLAEGALHLAGADLLAPHLTDENCRDLLEEVRHKTKRDIEKIVARLSPKPDVPDVVRRLSKPAPSPLTPAPTVPAPAPRPLPAPIVVPLAPERYKISFTASAEMKRKLDRARDLLWHRIPSGALEAIVEKALDTLLEELERQRHGATRSPRPARPSEPGSRRVSNSDRRAVYARDGHRCTFVSADGRRCQETGMLELHHLEPYALGGPTTISNLTVRCRAHNAYEGELLFG